MKLQLRDDTKIKLDKLIKEFNYSYMSNSKWKKVFLEILNNKSVIKRCEIIDFINPCINQIDWDKIDCNFNEKVNNDFLSEELTTGEYPTIYKYIEYVEFYKEWKVFSKHTLIKPMIIKQDTNRIKMVLSKIGMFEWEEDKNFLRLIGYRK